MLQYEPARIKPVVKDLAAHYVAPHSPAVLIAPVPKPVVTKDLGVKVMRLEGRVVDVALWALEEEEAVVVNPLIASIKPEEDCHVFACSVMNKLRGRERCERSHIRGKGTQ